MKKKITLEEFRLSELRHFPNATGQLSNLLREIALAAKRIHAIITSSQAADLTDELQRNASGELMKPLDQFANDELLTVLKNSVSCAGAASEEENEMLVFDNPANNKSKYVVMFDPLDGSSNCDNCMPVGTIFAIYHRCSPTGQACDQQDFLQSGRQLMAAGYIIYGSSTMLVYATKRGVNGFTLDSTIGEFCLTHPSVLCPPVGKIYSLNESNILRYSPAVIEYIRSMQQQNVRVPGTFNARYVGSMVADLHRTLFEGGIFLYPAAGKDQSGKLRLMYECNPFAFIFEAAGGIAINGYQHILDIKPGNIHERTPIFIGSIDMVNQLNRLFRYESKMLLKFNLYN